MRISDYGPFDYSPVWSRDRLVWPNNARVALWVIPNIEFFALKDRIPASVGGSGGPSPDVPSWAARDYGNRVGVFRVMEVLERYGITATAALNSSLCRHHPEILSEGNKRNWEWMGHNRTNTERLNELKPDEERLVIQNTLSTIAAATGKRPVGWLGAGLQETWSTLDILAEQRCEYVCDWVNDDQPYVMSLDDGRTLVSVPYSQQLNDKQVIERQNHLASDFEDIIKKQFDVLWREGEVSGRVMAISLHPYIIGVPHRIKSLENALEYICRHDGVWKTTGAEIATYYKKQVRASEHKGG